MQNIPVELSDKLESFEILEVQGDIESGTTLNGQTLGYLLEDGKKSELIIQNKLLDGAPKLNMPKPLYVLEKKGDGYEIVGIAREKYLFSSRPNPMSPRSVEMKTGEALVTTPQLNFELNDKKTFF